MWRVVMHELGFDAQTSVHNGLYRGSSQQMAQRFCSLNAGKRENMKKMNAKMITDRIVSR